MQLEEVASGHHFSMASLLTNRVRDKSSNGSGSSAGSAGLIRSTCYDAEALCADCVGRYILRDPKLTQPFVTHHSQSTALSSFSRLHNVTDYQLQLTSLIDRRVYERCYEVLIRCINHHYATGQSLYLPPIGVLLFRRHAAFTGDIDAIQPTSYRCHFSCLFDNEWLQSHHLFIVPDSCSAQIKDAQCPFALSLNFSTLARVAKVELSLFRTAVSHMFQRIGEVLSLASQVSIELGVGTLVGCNGTIDFVFHDQQEMALQTEDDRKARIEYSMSTAKIVNVNTVAALSLLVQQSKRQANHEQKELLDMSDHSISQSSFDFNTNTIHQLSYVPLPLRNIKGTPMLQPLRTKIGCSKQAGSNLTLASSFSGLHDDVRAFYPLLSPRACSPGHKQKQQQLFARKLPPLLDEFVRTRAAPLMAYEAGAYISSSSRIASYYTPAAINFQIDPTTSQLVYIGIERVRSTGSNLQIGNTSTEPTDNASLDSRAVDKSRALREYYIDHIPQTVLTPYCKYWARRVISLLRLGCTNHKEENKVSALSSHHIHNCIDAMLKEIQADYYATVRHAMLDYILRSPAQRIRLMLLDAPTHKEDWGHSALQSVPPRSWRARVQQAFRTVSANLCIFNPAALFLLSLWHKQFHDRLLCQLPSTLPLETTAPPMTLKAFETIQKAVMTESVQVLRSEYMTAVEKEMATYTRVAGLTDENSGPFFESIAVLMSRQLRSTIESSIDSVKSFVKKYVDGPTLAFQHGQPPTLSGLCMPSTHLTTVIALRLTVQKSKDGLLYIEFDQPLHEIGNTFSRLMHLIIHSLNGLIRVENKIFNVLDSSSILNLYVDEEAGQELRSIGQCVQAILEVVSTECQRVLRLYEPYLYLLDEDKRISSYLTSKHHLKEHQNRLVQYRLLLDEFRNQLVTVQPLQLYMCEIDCRPVNSMLMARCDDCIEAITADISQRNIQSNLALIQRCKLISTTLLKKPSTTHELVELQTAALQFKQVEQSKLQAECDELKTGVFFLLDTQQAAIDPSLLTHISSSYSWLHKLNRIIFESETLIDNERGRMEKTIEEKMEAYNTICDELTIDIKQLQHMNEKSKMNEYLNRISAFKVKIAEAEAEVATLIDEEKMLGLSHSDVHQLSEVKTYLAPFDALWNLAQIYHKQHNVWLRGSILKLDGMEVEVEVNQMVESAASLYLQLTLVAPEVAKVAAYLRAELTSMQQQIPLLHVLCNPGMRERHWTQISAILGYDLKPDIHTTLARVLELNISPHALALHEISILATKEHTIEKALAFMRGQWQDIMLPIRSWRETGTYLFTSEGLEDSRSLLDDHNMRMVSLKGSPNSTPFIEELRAFDAWLSIATTITESSSAVQSVWLYLSPLFGGEDMSKQLPNEAALFQNVDILWRSFMSQVCLDTHLTSIVLIPRIALQLKETLTHLEGVQAGMNNYLESKRVYFPRFYFLSNDEILAILSETKDPVQVMPHMSKIFPGISSIRVNITLDLTAMCSSEGELVTFSRYVSTLDARGAVERWLREVERSMKETMKETARKALTTYTQEGRLEWMLRWPMQTVLLCLSLHFSANVNKALQQGGVDGLKLLSQRQHQDMQALSARLSATQNNLEWLSLSNVMLHDLHARDVVDSLCQSRVSSVQDFDWQAQLRFYWNHTDDTVEVKSLSNTLLYGMEYYGHLAVPFACTPSTDRCYRALCLAFGLHLAGCTQGVPGSGTSETIRSLAAVMASPCFTFNATPDFDAHTISKFLRGLASSGWWSCFENFASIKLEALSVVSQQISAIQHAKLSRQPRLFLDGTEIILRPQCQILITMGKLSSDLPENLKQHFRICSLQTPDIALITYLRLCSSGFVNSSELARKLSAAFSSFSKLLSPQAHYDFGLRAMKTVLETAITIKRRKLVNKNESLLIAQALDSCLVPSLVDVDHKMFHSIIDNLFGHCIDVKDSQTGLHDAIQIACAELGLQADIPFVSQVEQLYEVIRARHSVMLIGQPYSGKSSTYRVLAAALNALAGSPEALINGTMETGVDVCTYNPKSLTMEALYGSFGADRAFTEGVLTRQVSTQSQDASARRKWIVMDSPVDSTWTDSLQTLLDNSRTLCLPDGRVVKLNKTQTCILETRDLESASPATVSRCAVLHFSPRHVHWKLLMRSRLLDIPRIVSEAQKFSMAEQFECLVPALWNEYSQCLSESVQAFNLCHAFDSCMSILLALIFKKLSLSSHFNESISQVTMDAITLFSLAWGFGGALDDTNRQRIDTVFRKVISEKVGLVHPSSFWPDWASAYSMHFVFETEQWCTWFSLVPQLTVSLGTDFSRIVVPTVDTTRYNFILLSLAINAKANVLVLGGSGCGKSVIVQNSLTSVNTVLYECVTVHFSARTDPAAIQATIDDRVERRRRGIWGAPGNRRLLIFVEDLNLPLGDETGSQGPCELLRSLIDQHGWWDQRDKSFHTMEDVGIVAAMSLNTGAAQLVSSRLQRHFVPLRVAPFERSTLTHIFGTLLHSHLEVQQFVPSVYSLSDRITEATLDLYQLVSSQLLPTPTKTHYTYNVRDISRVFQGLTLAPATQFPSPEPFLRLWLHEVHRVFADRLVDDADSQVFLDWCRNLIQSHFSISFPQLMAHLDEDHDGLFTAQEVRSLFFGDHLNRHRSPRLYTEITDLKKLHNSWSVYLEEYNLEQSRPMNLTLFRFAIEHVSRLSRILRQPGAHALLIGLGGSGRQSLTRLAAFVSGCHLTSINISRSYTVVDWRADLRTILRRAASSPVPVVFLLTDGQIIDESYLEDVSGLLHSGAVPNLWNPEEMTELTECVRLEYISATSRKSDAEPTRGELLAYFSSKVQRNLHVVLVLSPGQRFADCLRAFPALVSCCSIDWYAAWPHDALWSVAREFTADLDLEDSAREAAVAFCIYLHRHAESISAIFYQELGRTMHVTPTSYLELLTTFKTLLAFKRKEITKLKQRYLSGLEKLALSEKEICTMQDELEELKPILERTRIETDEMMCLVQAEAGDAQIIRDGVAQEEKIATAAADQAKLIEAECAASLSEALPMLDAAVAALDTLSSQEISELKVMRSPPKGVKLVLEALCILKKIGPARVPDSKNNGAFVTDYWEPSKKYVLSDMKLLKSLVTFEKDDIAPAIMKKIRAYLSMPDFELNKLKATSAAAGSIAAWIYAIEGYDRVIKHVQPKREALAAAQSEYASLKASLEAKQAELVKVEEKMDGLNATLKTMIDARVDLEDRMKNCALKIERAHILISRLGGERDRWIAAVDSLTNEYARLPGDMLLSSAVIAYLGPLNANYRQRAVSSWCEHCKDLPFSTPFSLSTILGEAVQTRRWVIEGLPNDQFSIENALIISKSRRWPLLIDPEGQANAWIRAMERDNNLVVISASDDFESQLEKAIEHGLPCLLEHVTEKLDVALDPLLLKHIHKRGGNKAIKIHGKELIYNDSFRLFMTTQLSNPQYLPEIAVKVTLLNFQITQQGLCDQLLSSAVLLERAELETERHRLVIASAANSARLKELEDRILAVMHSSKGDILSDESAIDVLSASKAIVNEIMEKQKISAKTEADIESSRINYQPLALHASTVFFALQALEAVNALYHFSLPWFMSVYQSAIAGTLERGTFDQRVAALKVNVTKVVYEKVSRALDENHKLLFAMLLVAYQHQSELKVSESEWRWFVSPNSVVLEFPEINTSSWLKENSWINLLRLASSSTSLCDLATRFSSEDNEWQAFALSDDCVHGKLPTTWSHLGMFHRMCLIAVLQPAQLIRAMQHFVQSATPGAFMDCEGVDLDSVWKESSPITPILIIAHPDCHTNGYLNRLIKDCNMAERFHRITLGASRVPQTIAAINKAQHLGECLIIENIHQSRSLLPQLSRICDLLGNVSGLHADFRLVFTTEANCGVIPSGILQSSIKVALQGPRSLRAHLAHAYTRDPLRSAAFFSQSPRSHQLHCLSFAMAFAHAVICERTRYVNVGYAHHYSFTDRDLSLALDQLDEALRSEQPLMSSLRELVADLTYGGRVTDINDQLVLRNIFSHYLSDAALQWVPGSEIQRSGDFSFTLPSMDNPLLAHIAAVPAHPSPATLGLHTSAQVARNLEESRLLLSDFRLAAHRTHHQDARQRNAVVLQTVADILIKVPACFDEGHILLQYPSEDVRLPESALHSVLLQECRKLNALMLAIQHSLCTLQLSLTGARVVSRTSEELALDLFEDRIPKMWATVCYRTQLGLTSFVQDLRERCSFFNCWIKEGMLTHIRAGAFFDVSTFLSALKYRYALAHQLVLDQVDLRCCLTTKLTEQLYAVELQGLLLNGAEWDPQLHCLRECTSIALLSTAPSIIVEPYTVSATQLVLSNAKPLTGSVVNNPNIYRCPIIFHSTRLWSDHLLSIDLPVDNRCSSTQFNLFGASLIASNLGITT